MRSMKNRYLPTPSQVTQKMAESGRRSCCCNPTCRGSQICWDLGSSIEASGRALGWGYIGSSVLEAPCPRLITNEYGLYHLLSKPQFSSMYPPPPSHITVLWQQPQGLSQLLKTRLWPSDSAGVSPWVKNWEWTAHDHAASMTSRHKVATQFSGVGPWGPNSMATKALDRSNPNTPSWHILGAEGSSRQGPTANSNLEVIPGDHSYLFSRLSHEE